MISSSEYILKRLGWEKSIVLSAKCKEIKKPKISYICDKTLLLSNICNKCRSKDEKIFKEEESIEILKILRLITLKIWARNLDLKIWWNKKLFPWRNKTNWIDE